MFTDSDFFNLLFDPGEHTCFTQSPKGANVYPAIAQNEDDLPEFFCINPLDPSQDHNPTKPYHAKDKPRRADHNVIKYRSFLIEMDKIGLTQQKDHIAAINMPYSTVCYSGNKSYHFIICLDEPCIDETEYRDYAIRIQRAVGLNLVDKSTKNPSRLSRYPGAFRADTERCQVLKYVGKRINKADLEEWLLSLSVFKGKPRKHLPIINVGDNMPSLANLTPFTVKFMSYGAKEGERNISLYKAACDFARCGFELDDTVKRLSRVVDLDDSEIDACVQSAYSKIKSKNV